MVFIILACDKCGQTLLARGENRTRRCPYCGNLIKITRLNIVASTEDAETARELLKSYKLRKRRGKEDQVI
ncbi:MAG: DUF1922 domain-containing protein [Candidatus Bathyarchaeia archaeon]